MKNSRNLIEAGRNQSESPRASIYSSSRSDTDLMQSQSRWVIIITEMHDCSLLQYILGAVKPDKWIFSSLGCRTCRLQLKLNWGVYQGAAVVESKTEQDI